ncbi:MAG: hypothetical protein WAO98_04295 [Alphaproteobacteria bacterium]
MNAVAKMSEQQAVNVVRNALLVAGTEMGEGDHWPVINATVHSIAKDYENLKIERAVDAEMKTHLYSQLQIMERELPNCTLEARIEVAAKLMELREIYDAYFSSLEESAVVVSENDVPVHVQRAKTIISTLEHDHD